MRGLQSPTRGSGRSLVELGQGAVEHKVAGFLAAAQDGRDVGGADGHVGLDSPVQEDRVHVADQRLHAIRLLDGAKEAALCVQRLQKTHQKTQAPVPKRSCTDQGPLLARHGTHLSQADVGGEHAEPGVGQRLEVGLLRHGQVDDGEVDGPNSRLDNLLDVRSPHLLAKRGAHKAAARCHVVRKVRRSFALVCARLRQWALVGAVGRMFVLVGASWRWLAPVGAGGRWFVPVCASLALVCASWRWLAPVGAGLRWLAQTKGERRGGDLLFHAKGETVSLSGRRLELKGGGDKARRGFLRDAIQDVRRVLHLAPGKVHAVVGHQRQKRRGGP